MYSRIPRAQVRGGDRGGRGRRPLGAVRARIRVGSFRVCRPLDMCALFCVAWPSARGHLRLGRPIRQMQTPMRHATGGRRYVAEDVQLELVLLEPRVRVNLSHDGRGTYVACTGYAFACCGAHSQIANANGAHGRDLHSRIAGRTRSCVREWGAQVPRVSHGAGCARRVPPAAALPEAGALDAGAELAGGAAAVPPRRVRAVHTGRVPVRAAACALGVRVCLPHPCGAVHFTLARAPVLRVTHARALARRRRRRRRRRQVRAAGICVRVLWGVFAIAFAYCGAYSQLHSRMGARRYYASVASLMAGFFVFALFFHFTKPDGGRV